MPRYRASSYTAVLSPVAIPHVGGCCAPVLTHECRKTIGNSHLFGSFIPLPERLQLASFTGEHTEDTVRMKQRHGHQHKHVQENFYTMQTVRRIYLSLTMAIVLKQKMITVYWTQTECMDTMGGSLLAATRAQGCICCGAHL